MQRGQLPARMSLEVVYPYSAHTSQLPCMAPLPTGVSTILLLLALAHVAHSTGHLLKGLVTCSDCAASQDLSGVKVAVNCGKQKVSAVTNEDGYFEIGVPANSVSISSSSPSANCFAVLLGGPEQLCAFKRNMVSKIVKVESSNSFNLSTSLTFFTKSCLSITERPKQAAVVSSKTIGPFAPGAPGIPDMPALPPFYYYRFMPIIGIP